MIEVAVDPEFKHPGADIAHLGIHLAKAAFLRNGPAIRLRAAVDHPPLTTSTMIIWGSTGKRRQVGSGTFFCPACRQDAAYALMRVSRYFTLYFIPLFETRNLGEYVRCGSCQAELNPQVTTLSRQQIEAALAPWPCPKCGNLNAQNQQQCLACSAPRVLTPPPLPGGPSASLPAPSQSAVPQLGPPPPAEANPGSYDY